MLDANTTALLGQLGLNADAIESLISASIVLTVLALAAAIPTAVIAKRRGRSRTLWVLFALTIPVLPLLLVWLLPKAKAPADGSPPSA